MARLQPYNTPRYTADISDRVHLVAYTDLGVGVLINLRLLGKPGFAVAMSLGEMEERIEAKRKRRE